MRIPAISSASRSLTTSDTVTVTAPGSAYRDMSGQVTAISHGRHRPGVHVQFDRSPDGRLLDHGWFDLDEIVLSD